ncbi:DUF1249 domain-containing protein [Fontimonas sp. SYSU GA230001]|uniref:DUF1249 domain-containing protein n=1 Tax=Fontimonas sp. SYSU GA230001 TaxID=3142450 RepID=UPI0032B4ABB9
MLANTHLCPCCGKPRRIAHLVELYEQNYRLLQRLVPELDAPYREAVSRSPSDCPLHLQIAERDRYTVTLRLSYEFTDEAGVRRQPDLWVRLYRDAAVAEALECNERPPWLAIDEADPAAHQYLSAQWRRNLMLNKWLEYLLDHGHGFGMAERPRLAEFA